MRYRLSAAAFVFLAISTAAGAADLPARIYTKAPGFVAPPFSWTGWYVGLTAGYSWGDAQFSVPAGSGLSFDTKGANIGSTLGFNWQAGSMVYGLEADASVNWLRGTDGLAGPCPACELKNPWFGTVRGRLGFAPAMTMYYVTGGLAYGGIRVKDTFGGDETHTKTGWTAGGGIEHAFNRRWSAKLEYLYIDLGHPKFGGGTLTTPFQENIVRAGLNAHF